MKVIIQIPCLNEEKTLPLVLKGIPKKIKNADNVEVLIIDDGSTDKTIQIAKDYGVKHFVRHRRNMGLARSFHDGITKALELGADIVVNTDGDNQYPGKYINDLVQPIINGQAEIVIADRQTAKISEFSLVKKLLQRFGSFIVNKAAGTDIPDAPSGFRAYSRESLMQLNIITRFSYTMETIIQAGNKRLAITSIPIKTNPKTRESRLFKNIWQHVFKSASAIIRAYIMYRPYVVFITAGVVFFVCGIAPFVRYAVLLASGDKGDHIQSLLFGAVLLIFALLCGALGVISDLIRTNRILHEDTLERVKRIQLK
ncbi:MAG: glycosyltransferase family 2 protein [Candidatus Woesebacteria bacterium]|jgi:glycosyltransferase involved in cell wall biosynthesis